MLPQGGIHDGGWRRPELWWVGSAASVQLTPQDFRWLCPPLRGAGRGGVYVLWFPWQVVGLGPSTFILILFVQFGVGLAKLHYRYRTFDL